MQCPQALLAGTICVARLCNHTYLLAKKQKEVRIDSMITQAQIPDVVQTIGTTLENAGYEAYLVGGCVRDLMIDHVPKDWDFTTNATPDIIIGLFPETYANNEYGTVGVVTESDDSRLKVIEITPYRLETGYTNARHPDHVTFAQTLEEDLKRRDFTINAIAYSISAEKIVDLFDGVEDIRAKRLKAVGRASERFSEDALRMMRAIRLAVELDFTIESETMAAMSDNAASLGRISKERIHDEFVRIINSSQPMQGILFLEKLGMLPFVAPDILRSIGIEQNQAHAFTVYEHLLRTLQHAADKNWSLEIRLAALFHDIAKPDTRRWSNEKNDWTFHGHEVVGARVTKKALESLKFSRETIDKVTKLVRWHMFFSDPALISLSAVRRTIRNVGEENIWDLLNLRICDRIGTGRPKEQPFRFRKYKSMVEEALHDPISVGMLKIDGLRIIKVSSEKPGPRIGYILHALLEEVLEDPTKNTSEYLEKRAVELMRLNPESLKALGESGKEKKEFEEEVAVKDIQKKHHVG